MTSREYITAIVGRFGVTPEAVNVLFVNRGIDPDSTANPKILKEALYDEVPNMLPALESISEGGLSYKYDMGNFKLWYANLCDELGKNNKLSNSYIKDCSNLF